MSAARAALDADPRDAMPYLVLGSALQEMGRWKEANHTYALCAKHATRGMVDECHAMLRAK
jgi:cytochrome c-type biogenesis protein CcmH/NrfG